MSKKRLGEAVKTDYSGPRRPRLESRECLKICFRLLDGCSRITSRVARERGHLKAINGIPNDISDLK